MRRAPLALLVLAILSPIALASPYAGLVRQGETATHEFDNYPKSGACIDLATSWTVTLASAPPTDALTLSAGGATATGSNGAAVVSFVSGVCTAFTITVTGTRVAAAAAYTLTTTSFLGGAVLGWEIA